MVGITVIIVNTNIIMGGTYCSKCTCPLSYYALMPKHKASSRNCQMHATVGDDPVCTRCGLDTSKTYVCLLSPP